METLTTLAIGAVITLFFTLNYLRGLKKRDARARAAAEKGKLFSEGPKAQHPHIDTNNCIGCGGCTSGLPGRRCPGHDGRQSGDC